MHAKDSNSPFDASGSGQYIDFHTECERPAMTNTSSLQAPAFDLSLAHQGLFSVADAADLQLTCREGSLWITLDHDARDIVLSAGESFLTPEHRRALVYALGPSTLSVSMAVAQPEKQRAGSRREPASGRVSFEFQAG
jgi:hypothetical protein